MTRQKVLMRDSEDIIATSIAYTAAAAAADRTEAGARSPQPSLGTVTLQGTFASS